MAALRGHSHGGASQGERYAAQTPRGESHGCLRRLMVFVFADRLNRQLGPRNDYK